MKYKVVRNFNDANKLIDKGYKVLKIDRDKRNRDYLVFLFEYSNELLADLDKITFNK